MRIYAVVTHSADSQSLGYTPMFSDNGVDIVAAKNSKRMELISDAVFDCCSKQYTKTCSNKESLSLAGLAIAKFLRINEEAARRLK